MLITLQIHAPPAHQAGLLSNRRLKRIGTVNWVRDSVNFRFWSELIFLLDWMQFNSKLHNFSALKFSFTHLFILLFLECGQGYYAASIGQYHFDRECRICPVGTFSDTDTAISCTQCVEGETTDQSGSTSCRPCKNIKNTFKFWIKLHFILYFSADLS